MGEVGILGRLDRRSNWPAEDAGHLLIVMQSRRILQRGKENWQRGENWQIGENWQGGVAMRSTRSDSDPWECRSVAIDRSHHPGAYCQGHQVGQPHRIARPVARLGFIERQAEDGEVDEEDRNDA